MNSSDQFNSLGGTQNINNGNGIQLNGPHFSGPVRTCVGKNQAQRKCINYLLTACRKTQRQAKPEI